MKNLGGAPPYEPTAYHRQKVRDLATLKMTQEQIALALHISIPTLMKYYGEEIEFSRMIVEAEISRVLLKRCRLGDIKAIQHWDATRGNYKPSQHLDLTSSDGSMSAKEMPTRVAFIAVRPGDPLPTDDDDEELDDDLDHDEHG